VISYLLDKLDSAQALTGAWDAITENRFQKRPFLIHCEKYNPCNQRYYCLSRKNELLAGAVVYTRTLDLLTFLKVKSRLRMHIAGVPCSVSSSGLIGDSGHFPELLKQLADHEKGFLLCLNLNVPPVGTRMITGRTWPSIIFANPFLSWEEYLKSLRSHYRRRLAVIEKTAEKIKIRTSPCRDTFTNDSYAMYEAVYQRSQGKLEKLSPEFFCNLPPEFNLTTYALGDKVLGWTISVVDDQGRFYFFLGGQDYSHDPINIYLVKVMTILQQGIVSGATHIDLGQSAEIPKMRFGGRIQNKYMTAYHSNPVVRTLIGMGNGLLSYNRQFPETSCFVEKHQ
jgi:hypothetical protein